MFNNMKKIILWSTYILTFALLLSCNNDKNKSIEKDGNALSNNDIENINVGSLDTLSAIKDTTTDDKPFYKILSTGLKYHIFDYHKNEIFPNIGDVIILHMEYSLHDSLLFSSNEMPELMKMRMSKPKYPGSINEGIMQMHQYDSAEFVIDAIKFYKETRELVNIPEYISNGDSLIFNVRILKIISAEEWNNSQQQTRNKRKMQESSDIRRYILDEGIDAKELKNGIYRYVAKLGNEKSISEKSKVTIHYTGKYLDNNIFSSTYENNKPFSFTIGNNEVIKGLEIGLIGMQTNSELTLIIPYDQAYNDEQKGPIPPWTSLVFEIKVLSVN